MGGAALPVGKRLKEDRMAENRHVVRLLGAHVSYPKPDGGEKRVLNNITLQVRDGELLTMVGPTGCGKSTLLRLVLGSEKPNPGQALFRDQVIENPNRDRGIVYQRYSLFPHLSVVDNIAFGLELESFSLLQRLLRTPKYRRTHRQFRDQARELLLRMELTAEDAEKYPYELSGGMQQRVAIAQAMVMNPDVLLMDEPFGALDHETRETMQLLLLERWEQRKKAGRPMTIFFVTHDIEEGLFLGTRIIVLSQYYTADNPADNEGAKIVMDRKVFGGERKPKPTTMKYDPEFNALLEKIRLDGLNPAHRQRVSEFDLSHEDAWRPTQDEKGGVAHG